MAAPRRLVPVQEPYDTSDLPAVTKAKEVAAQKNEQRKFILAQFLSTPEGRDWFWHWLEQCNPFASTFVPGDPYSSAFSEGRRNVSTFLLEKINEASPEAMALMRREAKNA